MMIGQPGTSAVSRSPVRSRTCQICCQVFVPTLVSPVAGAVNVYATDGGTVAVPDVHVDAGNAPVVN